MTHDKNANEDTSAILRVFLLCFSWLQSCQKAESLLFTLSCFVLLLTLFFAMFFKLQLHKENESKTNKMEDITKYSMFSVI